MNKQFDVFVKMKITEMSKTIHDMTYTYINPETKKPTDVPAKHYQDILKQPVEVMVEEQVKRQFLNVMFKQLKNLKEEEPHLFYQSLLLMDIGKSPDSLAVNEEVALKMTADYMVNEENKPKKNRGRSLIVNLPGSPKGACENLQAVLEPIEHGIYILQGGKE